MFPRDFPLLLGLLSAPLLSPERPGVGVVTPDSDSRLARKFCYRIRPPCIQTLETGERGRRACGIDEIGTISSLL